MHDEPTRIWKALSDPTRRQLLDQLRTDRKSTGELVDAFPHLSRFAVMKHLGVLEDAHLVLVRREGRMRWNHLNAVPLREMYERWVSKLDDGWAASLTSIGRLAETVDRDKERPAVETQETLSTSKPRLKTLVEQEHRIAASVETTWDVLVNRRGDWQPLPFRVYAGEGVITYDLRPGGVIAETWEGGGFALWGTINEFRPQQSFEYTGQFGMGGALWLVRFEIEASTEGSVLRLVHKVFGDIEDNDVENYTALWDASMGNLVIIAEQN